MGVQELADSPSISLPRGTATGCLKVTGCEEDGGYSFICSSGPPPKRDHLLRGKEGRKARREDEKKGRKEVREE